MKHLYKQFEFSRFIYREKANDNQEVRKTAPEKSAKKDYVSEGDKLINAAFQRSIGKAAAKEKELNSKNKDPFVKETQLTIDQVDLLRGQIKSEFKNVLEGLAKKSYNPNHIMRGLNQALAQGKLADLTGQIEDFYNAPNAPLRPIDDLLFSYLRLGTNEYLFTLKKSDSGQFYVGIDSYYVGPQYTEEIDTAMEALRLSQDKMSPGEYQRKMNRMKRVAERLLARAERRTGRIVERAERKQERLARRDYKRELRKFNKTNTEENEALTQQMIQRLQTELVTKINAWKTAGVDEKDFFDLIDEELAKEPMKSKLDEIYDSRSKLYRVEMKFAAAGSSFWLRMRPWTRSFTSQENSPEAPDVYSAAVEEDPINL